MSDKITLRKKAAQEPEKKGQLEIRVDSSD